MSSALTEPPSWVADAVFYQIFPDRFAASSRVPKPGPLEPWDAPPTVHGFKGGDLLGIVERLDHVADLGATALYLNPVFASASNHRYHTYDYLQVDPLLGGNDALRELLEAAHGRGMRVMLDGVFNHASRGFWPFHHVLETGHDSPYRDWFYFDQQRLAHGLLPNAYPDARPSGRPAGWARSHEAGSVSATTLGYRAWWDLPALPKLNTGNPQVREYLLNVAERWVDFGIDGWRLDVAEEIADVEFWHEFRRRVRRANPEAYIAAEIWQERPAALQGDTYDGLTNYPLAEAIMGYAAGSRLDIGLLAGHRELAVNVGRLTGSQFLARLERAVTAYRRQAVHAMLNPIDSHDTPRLRSLANGDTRALRLAWMVQMTVPGAPCIFYGDEIGLEGGNDPDCRRAFPWDESAWDSDLLAFVRRLIQLRGAHAVLRHGALTAVGAREEACGYLRSDGDASWLVALNAGDESINLPVALPGLDGTRLVEAPLPGEAVPAAPRNSSVVVGGTTTLHLAARAGLLLRLEPPAKHSAEDHQGAW